MFKDLKTNGFDIEGTKVTNPKRLETLLIVMTLAHILSPGGAWRDEKKRRQGLWIRPVGFFLLGYKASSTGFNER